MIEGVEGVDRKGVCGWRALRMIIAARYVAVMCVDAFGSLPSVLT